MMRQFIKDNKPYSQTNRVDLVKHYLSIGCEEVPILYQGNFVDAVWNGVDFVEGATQEEINASNQSKTLEQAKAFMAQKESDGLDFFKDIDLRITIALSAIERAVLFPKLSEIDSLLYPPLNKIKTGDFASALYLFNTQSTPADSFVLNFYNEAFTYCQTYYDTKYPK